LLEKKWLQHAAVADQWKLKTTKKNQFGNQKNQYKIRRFSKAKINVQTKLQINL
jgi:hypothetical protein